MRSNLIQINDISSKLLLFGVVVSATFLNKIAILIIPMILIFHFFYGKSKSSYVGVNSFIFFLLTLWWYFNGFLFFNYFISVLLFSSFLSIFSAGHYGDFNIFKKALKLLVIIMIVNSALGFVQMSIYRDPDAFIGLFGRGGLQSHGLAIIYALLIPVLHFDNDLFGKNRSKLIIFIFSLSFILCFYGSGLIFVILSCVFVFVVNKNVKYLIMTTAFIPLAMLAVFFFDEAVYYYNIKVFMFFIEHIEVWLSTGSTDEAPRRLVLFFNYLDLASNDILYVLFGSGPGTFNSRVSFLLNGDYSSFEFLPVSIHPDARDFVFPLWNSELLARGYQDGSMNQPFSSFISVIAEYGVFVFVFSSFYIFNKLKVIYYFFQKELFLYLFSLLFFLLFFENMYEYMEIIFVFYIIVNYFIKKKILNLYS